VKTISLKKVAVVAVASLGFGLLSVAPAQAAAITAWTKYEGNVTSISLSSATSSPVTSSAVYVNVGAKTVATGTAAGSTTTGAITQLRGTLVSYPAGGFVQVTSSTNVAGASAGTPTVPAGTDVVIANTNNTGATGANSIFIRDIEDAAGVAAYDVTTSATTGLASMTFTPTVAGTYELRVWNDGPAQGVTTIGNNTIDSNEAVQSISITVAAAPGLSTALSTVLSAQDTGNAGVLPTATTTAAGITSAQTLDALAGRILVTTRKTTNVLAPGHTITAIVTGSGFVTAGNTANDAPTAAQVKAAANTAAQTRTASVAAAANTNGQVVVAIWGDGTGGTGTVTIQVTDSVSGATTTIGTVKTSFYGTVTTLKATVLQSNATAGATNGCANVATCTQATLALTPAVVIEARDTNGILVPGLTITGKSADTSVVAATTVAIVDGTGTDKNGLGFYNASVTGGAAANVGKSTTIVYSTIVSSTVTISTAAVTIKNMGTPATVTWSTDKTTYTPGAPVVITVTAKDAAGNAAADGTYANLFAGASTLGGSITGSTPAAQVEILDGKATYTAFAPGTAGTYAVSNKFGASMPAALQGAAISTSIVVSDPNAGLLTQIDALNAKIVALNALIAKIMKRLGVK